MDILLKSKKIVVCTLFAVFTLLSGNVFATSSVWKVTKGSNYFYLGATIHLLESKDYPLPAEFNKAYKDAGILVFETDLRAMQNTEFQAKSLAAMTYHDNRTLTDVLNSKTYQELVKFMGTRQIPMAKFMQFQPWGLSVIITILEYKRLGLTPQYGVDTYFNNLALADSKKIMGLETPEEQLSFFDSMAKIDPNEIIESTIQDLEALPELIILIKENWRSGDLEALAQSDFIIKMKTKYPEMYATLVTNRNNAWVQKLQKFTDDSDIEFILVGAMHLYGKEGLIDQLKTRGFTIEQI